MPELPLCAARKASKAEAQRQRDANKREDKGLAPVGSFEAAAREWLAFIHEAKGDKKDAVSIMIEILKSEAETLPPQEVNYMRDYICNRILDEQEAAVHPLCQDPIP